MTLERSDLRTNEERYRTLFESLDEVVWEATLQGMLLHLNQAAESVYGRPLDELRSNPNFWIEAVHPEDKALAEASANGLFNEGRAEVEYRIVRPDGSIRWLWDRKQAIRDDAGNTTSFGGVCTDITELKLTDEALQESERFASKVVEFSLTGIYIYDFEKQKNTFINPRYTSLTGYTLEALQGMTGQEFLSLFHPCDLDTVMRHLEQVVQAGEGEGVEIEYRFRKADGAWLWCLSLVTVFDRNPDGTARLMMGSFLDITARKQIDEALRTSRENYRSLFEQAVEGIYQLSLKGGFLRVNPALAEIYRYETPQAMLLDFSAKGPEALRYDSPNRCREFLDLLEKNSSVADFESQIHCNDKEIRWISENARVVRDAAGETSHIEGFVEDITERKHTEEALLESEAKFRGISASAQEAILMMDDQGAVAYWNKAAEQIFGYSAEEAMGRDLHNLLAPRKYYEAFKKGFDLFKKTGQGPAVGKTLELEALRKDGSKFPMELSLSSVKVKDKWIAIGILRDITERIQAEEAIRGTAQRYRTVFDSVADTIQIYDFGGNLHDVNRAGCERLGYSKEELLTMRVSDINVVESVEGVQDRMKLLREQGHLSFDVTHRHRDGTHIEMEMNSQVIDLDGKPMVFCVGRDVTERKQAEEELRQREARFSLLAESLDEVFWLGEAQEDGIWRLVYVSPAVEKLFGVTSKQVYASNEVWFKAVHEDDLERVEQTMEDFLQNSESYNIEYRLRLPDDNIRWIWARGSMVCDTNGKHCHTVEISQDITQRREMERRSGLNQKLESIGQLAAGIAHEINTPTQYVGDNTRFLQDAFKDVNVLLERYGALLRATKEDDRFREMATGVEETATEIDLEFLQEEIPKAIEQTLEGVDRVATIVQAMKRFSHPESGEKKPVDINEAIESTVTVARNEWKYVAEVELDLDRNLPPVPCSPGDFNQVILNMVVNAAHAIAAQGNKDTKMGLITLSTRLMDGFAEIRIRDTGTGIPAELQDKVFDPFFTTKDVGKGTGQGLAIAQDIIVNKHHGDIHLESNVGMGTEFIIRLPLHTEARNEGKKA
jgi:two-component system, NtrC family, sensor kinase